MTAGNAPTTPDTRVVAVDWSGRKRGAAEFIWLAHVVGGRLVELENGRSGGEVIDYVIALSQESARCVVGLDFAFGFPAWYAAERGWTSGREIWDAMRDEADELLARCEAPFWGRPGTRAQTAGEPYRATELALAVRPKSVFQIGGAGAVGTGSLRGMQHLARLTDAGFAVWPFHDPALPLAVEIYPRLFVPRGFVKRDAQARRRWLESRSPEQPAPLLERAARSEDAFDAAISALAMAERVEEFNVLASFPADARERLEGAIWTPRALGAPDAHRSAAP